MKIKHLVFLTIILGSAVCYKTPRYPDTSTMAFDTYTKANDVTLGDTVRAI